MFSLTPSTFCVEFFLSAVFIYMFFSFPVISLASIFLCFTLIVYIFARRGQLSKLSIFFSNAKPLMTFSLGHMHICFIVSTSPETAREVTLNKVHRVTHGQSNTQREHVSGMMQSAAFQDTDDQKQANGDKDSLTCVSDSSSSKPQRRTTERQHLESSMMKRPLIISKKDDQNSVTKVKSCSVLKMDTDTRKPTRKKSFTNDKPTCKDPITVWTCRENRSIESRKQSEEPDRKKSFSNDKPTRKDPITGWTYRENRSFIESRKQSKEPDRKKIFSNDKSTCKDPIAGGTCRENRSSIESRKKSIEPDRKKSFLNDKPTRKDPITGWTCRENISSIESRKQSKEPGRKKSFSNDKPTCKDPITGGTCRENRSSIESRKQSIGETDVTEKPVDPIKVHSEKELVREFEKIASLLVPEKDWSIRIGAMQRVEGLVIGGATDYPCFRGLLKQLVGPLSTQLADRRSSIVKQACHLLNFLSKELLGDFESLAEMFIPAFFKLLVITVLVIAESADNCIKTMLRNCKVSRILPRVAETAKHDRSSILRARCCEYALLILEYWADAPEIQRSADLYEDLIKCCVGDAMSEVRSTARACYRMFSKTWPDRSRRLFSLFDPVIQRIINEEDGGMHRRRASPSLRERNPQMPLNAQSSASGLAGYGTSAIEAMDRNASLPSVSAASLSSGLLSSQSKPINKTTERSPESVLHASKQKVTAIESMLRGLDSGRVRSSSLDLGVDPPSSRDPPFPLAAPTSNSLTSSLSLDTTTSGISKGNNRNGGLVLSDIITQIQASQDSAKNAYRGNVANETLSSLSSYSQRRTSEKHQERSSFEDNHDIKEARRSVNLHTDRRYLEAPYRDSHFRDPLNSHVPNFQRPLSRKNAPGRMASSRRRSFDESQFSPGEMSSYTDGPASLNDALSDGLSSGSDWNARVSAFNYLRSLLQQGPKGVQEVTQSFEKVMKLFFQHLDDPHHKVAQAALTTLADVIPACRKLFKSYMERILPHVFSRLIDPKELVRQPCSTTLEIVGKTYGVDSLLPALLRSLDEQRSPKAKLAVIEFAIILFNKHAMNPEGAGNIGILKLWLAKLAPLVHDKNTKLREAAITCIISVYSHFDSASVLNYILSLSVEEQNSLRRALKQHTPRIEVDLMNYLQQKKDRQRSKFSYDPYDNVGTSSEGYIAVSKKTPLFGRYSGSSLDSDGGKKWGSGSAQESTQISSRTAPDGSEDNLYIGSNNGVHNINAKDAKWSDYLENNADMEAPSTPRLDGLASSDSQHVAVNRNVDIEGAPDLELSLSKLAALKINSSPETRPSIPQILHLISNGTDVCDTTTKRTSLQQLVDASVANDSSIWTKYFNQILMVVLEVLNDPDSSIRELALSLITEMLKNQRDAMEDSVEIVIEKLLNLTKDTIPKVSYEAEHCVTVVLSQYDPFRCLSVIVPLLVTEDEKTLVTCINCLTKLVGRLSQEELTTQLQSFLPALFDAFGNQSADVRKTVVFCLVDIYIMLGKAFLPHLEGLNSTQLRLVNMRTVFHKQERELLSKTSGGIVIK